MKQVEIRKNVYFKQEGEYVYGMYQDVALVKRSLSKELSEEELTEVAERIMLQLEDTRKCKQEGAIINNIYSEAYSMEEKKNAIIWAIQNNNSSVLSKNDLSKALKWLYEIHFNEMPFIDGKPEPEYITVSQEIIDAIFGENV